MVVFITHLGLAFLKTFPSRSDDLTVASFEMFAVFSLVSFVPAMEKKQSPRSPHTWGLIWSHPKNLVTPFYPDVQPLSFFLWDNDKTNMSPAKKGLEDKRFFWCNPCLGDICWFSAVTLSFWGVSFLLVTGPRRPLRMLQNALVGESQARCEKKPPLWMVLKPDHK